ncbi:MAG: DUF4406 domain-containing protein [Ruminococcus sp.]|nr:DUF4406 domain-containing protein [Ruminococcus sp.]
MTVVYLAGKIDGDPNYKEKFRKAAEQLESRGYIVLNPATLPEGMSKEKYMPICLAMLNQADIILLLSDYEESPGARIELNYANYQNKELLTYNYFISFIRRVEDEH